MGAPLNLKRVRYGKLVCMRPEVREGKRGWLCVCDCGERTWVRTAALRNGNTTSCGCWKRNVLGTATTKHGLAGKHPLYALWKGMRNRCNNPATPRYKDYGGRGIKVCKRWDKFENFVADMGPRPSRKHSLDRIRNNGNYTPSNCRWATAAQQRANSRPITRR